MTIIRDSPARLAFLLDITVIKHCHTKVLKINEDESILQKQTSCSIHFQSIYDEGRSRIIYLLFTALLRGSRSPPVTDLFELLP